MQKKLTKKEGKEREGMAIKYEENRIYTAECDICGAKYTTVKKSLTDMENFMRNNAWHIFKSLNAHQPNAICGNCTKNQEHLLLDEIRK